jgi:hypothetical protein
MRGAVRVAVWLVSTGVLLHPRGLDAQAYADGERTRVSRLAELRARLAETESIKLDRALADLAARDEPGVLAVWEEALATAAPAARRQIARAFAAVRDRLARSERVAQVVRLRASPARVAEVRRVLETAGGALDLTLWRLGTDQVIAALPRAARERLRTAGIAGEVLFDSVAEWDAARQAGQAAARAITPRYQSSTAADDYVLRVLVIDLSRSRRGADDFTWIGDRENVLARNDRYLAYLDGLPAKRMRSYLRRRYLRRGLKVVAVLTVDEFRDRAAAYFPELPPPTHDAPGVAAAFDGLFHSHADVTAELQSLAAQYPNRAKLISLGPSYEGREIWALKISRDVARDDPQKPDVLFTGCHHAREWISVEPPIYFAHRLLDDAAADGAIRFLADHAETWIVPIVNPDGLTYSQQSSNSSGDSIRFWRKNRRPASTACGTGTGIDLNRNYAALWRLRGDNPCPSTFDDRGASDSPSDFQLYRGPAPLSELEVLAIATLTADPTHNFVARVDFHNYGQLVLYPWSALTDPPADQVTLADLANVLARRIKAVHGVTYTPEQAVGLYVATGVSSDHAYAIDGTLAPFIWELRPSGCCFYVPENQIDPINRESWAGARTLLDWSIGPPWLTRVTATQQSGGGAFDVVVYDAMWTATDAGRTLEIVTEAASLQPGPLRLTVQFSKALTAGDTPAITLGRTAPFNELAAVAIGGGWQATDYGTDTWMGEVEIPLYGDGTTPWHLSVRARDGAELVLDAQAATVATYTFGTDAWSGYETGADLSHELPPSTGLGPSPTPTATVTRTRPPTRTPTRTPRPTLTRTPTWTRRPTATRTPTITPRPTRTATRTPTATWTRRPTITRTPTRTRRPTITRTPTITRWPTNTRTPTATLPTP